MSSVVISGDTSGAITLQAPAVSGNTTLNLPASSGTVLTQNSSAPANSFVVDASGNVGVGVTQSTDKFAVASSGNAAYFANNTANTLSNRVKLHLAPTSDFGANWSTFEPPYIGAFNNAGFADCGLVFNTYDSGTNAERMRITTNGNVLVGTATSLQSPAERFTVSGSIGNYLVSWVNSNASPAGLDLNYSGAAPNNTGNFFAIFRDTGANRFIFRSNGGLANYSANNVNLSDERLKTEIKPAKSYLDTICSIPVVTFKYKDQTDEELNLGVIAQSVDKIAPELVDHSGFGEAPEGESPYLAVYQTDLQYALMKSIQELKAIVDEQAKKIKALEAK